MGGGEGEGGDQMRRPRWRLPIPGGAVYVQQWCRPVPHGACMPHDVDASAAHRDAPCNVGGTAAIGYSLPSSAAACGCHGEGGPAGRAPPRSGGPTPSEPCRVRAARRGAWPGGRKGRWWRTSAAKDHARCTKSRTRCAKRLSTRHCIKVVQGRAGWRAAGHVQGVCLTRSRPMATSKPANNGVKQPGQCRAGCQAASRAAVSGGRAAPCLRHYPPPCLPPHDEEVREEELSGVPFLLGGSRQALDVFALRQGLQVWGRPSV